MKYKSLIIEHYNIYSVKLSYVYYNSKCTNEIAKLKIF